MNRNKRIPELEDAFKIAKNDESTMYYSESNVIILSEIDIDDKEPFEVYESNNIYIGEKMVDDAGNVYNRGYLKKHGCIGKAIHSLNEKEKKAFKKMCLNKKYKIITQFKDEDDE